MTDPSGDDLDRELPDTGHDALRRHILRIEKLLADRLDKLERQLTNPIGGKDRLDVVPTQATTAAQAGAKGLGIKLQSGWTWIRVAPDGTEHGRGPTLPTEGDAWAAAHRANPDL